MIVGSESLFLIFMAPAIENVKCGNEADEQRYAAEHDVYANHGWLPSANT
jgi:hypothetical protein